MELFGTDGIRSLVGEEPMTWQDANQIGMATAVHMKLDGAKVLVAGDTRASSPELMEAVADGIAQQGGNVELLDRFTTPGLALRVAQTDAAAGVVVTASHNAHSKDDPANRWNGIKIFGSDGSKLPDDDQDAITLLYNSLIFLSPHRGEITSGSREEHVAAYLKHLIGLVDGRQIFDGMNVGIDTAHGATTGIAAELVAALGGASKLQVIGGEPDGWNINDGVGATHMEAIRGLVASHGSDVGGAFDGDGDRWLGVDQFGRIIDGDMAVYIGAQVRGLGQVAMTVMTNGGVMRGLRERDIRVVETPVGDRNIIRAIDDSSGTAAPITFGGEKSGHIVDTEVGPTGDGMATFIRTVQAAQQSGLSLDQWRDRFQELLVPQALTSPRVTDKDAALSHPDVQAFLERARAEVGNGGRVIDRKSGTGDEIRLMVEHGNADLVERLVKEFDATVASTGLAA